MVASAERAKGVAGRDGCRIYLITPPALEPITFADSLAEALDAGDVAAVQLRLKDVDDDKLYGLEKIKLPDYKSYSLIAISTAFKKVRFSSGD